MMKENFIEYMREVFDEKFRCETIKAELPLFLERYELHRGEIWGLPFVFAFDENAKDEPGEYAKMGRRLKTELGTDVVFVFKRLATAKRNSLIRNGVSFVVPGLQIVIPPNFRLHERVPRAVVPAQSLRPSSQAVVIRQLICGDVDGEELREIGKTIGYSEMTMSNVAAELSELGVVEVFDWPKRMRFKQSGRALWEALQARMKSPVVKRIYNRVGNPVLPKAGISELAERTMIGEGKRPVYACVKGDERKREFCDPVMYSDEAASELEVWSYRPDICGAEIDPLSLHLSMRDRNDPRIQGELEKMLGGVQWR